MHPGAHFADRPRAATAHAREHVKLAVTWSHLEGCSGVICSADFGESRARGDACVHR